MINDEHTGTPRNPCTRDATANGTGILGRYCLVACLILCRATHAGDLAYTCDNLSHMAIRLVELKQQGYTLNDVMVVIQEYAGENTEKDEILSSLAIDIFTDRGVADEQDARRAAASLCQRR
jgi:hypothetical protein